MKNTIFYTLITLLFLLSCKKEKPEFEIQKSYHTFVIDGHLEECSFRMLQESSKQNVIGLLMNLTKLSGSPKEI